MKCHDVRNYLSPYLDSELDATAHFEIQVHASQCEACGARVQQELRLENALAQSVRSAAGSVEPAIWDRALAGALEAVTRKGRRRRWRLWSAAFAATALVACAVLYVASQGRRHELDIATFVLKDHLAYVTGRLPSKVETRSHGEVVRYFADKLDLSLARADVNGPMRLVGARSCHLNGVPVAYVLYRFKQTPVSLFVADRRSLASFPGAAAAFSPGRPFVHCFVEGYRFAMTRDTDRILCAIGAVETDVLDRLLASYLAP